jgi:hypothetical protein
MPIVASFAPELLELLKRASREPITIELHDTKASMRLCFQLNSLRKAMRLEQHPLVRIVSAVNINVTKDGNLFARPADSNFLAAIHAAGIAVPEVAPSSTHSPDMIPPTIQEFSVPLTKGDTPTKVKAVKPEVEEAKAALRAFLDDAPLPSASINTEASKED